LIRDFFAYRLDSFIRSTRAGPQQQQQQPQQQSIELETVRVIVLIR